MAYHDHRGYHSRVVPHLVWTALFDMDFESEDIDRWVEEIIADLSKTKSLQDVETQVQAMLKASDEKQQETLSWIISSTSISSKRDILLQWV